VATSDELDMDNVRDQARREAAGRACSRRP
jgi:hypothetical protein